MKKNKNISVRSTLLTRCTALLPGLTACTTLLPALALCAALLPALTACNDNDFTGNDGDKKNPADAVSLTVSLEGSGGTYAPVAYGATPSNLEGEPRYSATHGQYYPNSPSKLEGVPRRGEGVCPPTALAATRVAGTDAPYTPAADDALVLYNGSVGAADNQTATYYYTPGTPEGTTGTWGPKDANHPLYWDDMTAITDATTSGKLYSFYAVASHGQTLSTGTDGTGISTTGTVSHEQAALSTDGSTPENYNNADLLMGYTYTTKRKENLAFTLKHLLAQLTVTLTTTGDNAFSNDQLTGATATVSSLYAGYTLTYNSVTDETSANSAKSNPATATTDTGTGATPVTFTLLRTVNYTDGTSDSDGSGLSTAGKILKDVTFRLIAPPQTLTGDIVLTINGKSYTMSASGIELKQGTNTVQPIVATKTGLEPGTVTVTPWQVEEKGSQDVGADGIAEPTTALTGIKEAGTLNLYAYKSGGTDQEATGFYPISYTPGSDGQEGSASIDENDRYYQPIRWNNLDKYQPSTTNLQSYVYIAIFTPADFSIDGKKITDGADYNHEEDYLGGTSIATEWGTAPSFTKSNANADGSTKDYSLRHLMARFTVKLQCNDGTYDATALNAAKLTVVRKKKYSSISISSNGTEIRTKDADDTEKTVTLVKTADATDAGTGSAPAAQTATFEALICPQKLADAYENYLTLTLGSGTAAAKTYTLKAPAEGVTLSANQRYTLTANVKKTDVSIGTIDVTPWGDIDGGSGDFEWGGN